MGRRIKLSVDDERLGGVEIRHLAALAAVAGEGSLKGAARRLGYVQSAVSRQLAELEHAVDARLVERLPGAGGVRLTDAGRLLLGHAESILGRIIPRTPILARSRIPSFSPTHVSSWCPPARPYPSARVLLAPGDRSAATHPADRLPPQQRVDAALAAHGGPMRVTQSVTSDGGVRALVASGVGVAVLPRMSGDTADPDTVAVELGDELPPRRLVLAWNRERRPHPDGQRFRHAVNNGCERLRRERLLL